MSLINPLDWFKPLIKNIADIDFASFDKLNQASNEIINTEKDIVDGNNEIKYYLVVFDDDLSSNQLDFKINEVLGNAGIERQVISNFPSLDAFSIQLTNEEAKKLNKIKGLSLGINDSIESIDPLVHSSFLQSNSDTLNINKWDFNIGSDFKFTNQPKLNDWLNSQNNYNLF